MTLSLGFPVDDEKQFAMAVQDVSVAFAREMKGLHINGLDTDKLIAFRIFDKLVNMRIHGID